MERSFPIVHPQGIHVNITEVYCAKLELYSTGVQVKFLTQGVTLGIHLSSFAFKSASSDRSLHIICPRYEKEVTTFNIFPPIVIICALLVPAFLESMYMTQDFEGLKEHETQQ